MIEEPDRDEEMADVDNNDEGIDLEEDAASSQTEGRQEKSHDDTNQTTEQDSRRDVEMEDVDSGVSVTQSGDGSDHEPEDLDPTTPGSVDENFDFDEEWKKTVNFINEMNKTLALAWERIQLADEALLNARDALPGYVQGFLEDY